MFIINHITVREPAHQHHRPRGPVVSNRRLLNTRFYLIESLGDEVSREVAFKLFLVLERVVQLRVGHGARLEPAIKHLKDTILVLGGEGQIVFKRDTFHHLRVVSRRLHAYHHKPCMFCVQCFLLGSELRSA